MITVLTWNIAWADAASKQGQFINGIIDDVAPDVICFTEATLGMIPEGGHAIESHSDYGYKNPPNRRKVVLWSKTPWQEADSIGHESMPSGRFATGISQGIRFIGVCIPWKDAHVRTGRKDRLPWQDHRAYLDGLGGLVSKCCDGNTPVCVIGDYNQRIPRSRQPVDVAEKLACVMNIGLRVATLGRMDEEYKQLIDHIATSEGLTTEVVSVLSKTSPKGLSLSDHSGIVVQIESQEK